MERPVFRLEVFDGPLDLLLFLISKTQEIKKVNHIFKSKITDFLFLKV